MGLSGDLISQFVKITNDNRGTKKETTVYGTMVSYDGSMYVRLDGSELLTPISTTTDTLPGERVTVMIKNHTATVTGNISAPSARSYDVDDINDRLEKLSVNEIIADNVIIKEKLTAVEADIDTLKANNADITNLEADIAKLDTLIFGSASGDVIHTSFSNSVIAQLGDAQIKSAMIESVAASKITSGDIITNNVRVMSEDGKLLISDETLQISDSTRVRVQIGKDASNDYSINIWDSDGKLMFSKGGITDNAIKDAIIRNDMVSDTANISAHKLDIDSLFEEINDSSNTIKSTKIYLDDKKQTLDVSFKTLETNISNLGETVTSQGTKITTIQGQISSKIWQQDIDTATGEMSTQYSTLSQELSGFKTTVGNTYATKDDLNGLTIGGRNLIRDSKLDIKTDMWSFDYAHQTISFQNGYVEVSRVADSSYPSRAFSSQQSGWNPLLMPDEISGETYILSVDMKAIEGIPTHSNSTLFWRVYYDNSTSYEEITLTFPSDLSDSRWKRYYVKKTFGTRNWTSSQVSIALNNSDNGICVRNLMLEKASTPSSWTPAPEDMDSKIVSTETLITQNANDISAIASRVDENGSSIAELLLTADGLTTKVNAAKKQKPHEADGTTGTAGYIGFCTVKVTAAYVNVPITFSISNRGQQSSNVSFCLSSVNNTDPSLVHIQNDGGIKLWAYKSNTSTWILIAQKSEGYDVIYVNDYSCPRSGLSLSWSDIQYDSLPTSNITAATQLAGKLTKATVDNAAKTATNYLNFSTAGLVIGDMTASTLGKNVLIDSDSVDIRNGSTTLASFGADYLYLAKNSRNATIDLCNGLAKLYHQSKYSYDTLFIIDTPNATEIQGTYNPLCITSTVSGKVSIQFANTSGVIGSIGMVESGTESYITRNHPSTAATYSVLDTGNFYKIMDSGYVNVVPQSGFTIYSNGNDIKYRKLGRLVEVSGVMKPTSEIAGSDTKYTMGVLPQTCWPARPINILCQGSGIYVWMLTVTTGGELQFSKYRNGDTRIACPVGAWLPFHVTYFAE